MLQAPFWTLKVTLVIESKHEGSKQPIITRKYGAGGPKKSQKPQSNVFYSEYSKSFFNLT